LRSAAPAAQAAERKWGVPASVTLAQWIFESTWGTSKLALQAINYFGIKYSHQQSPCMYVEFPSPEYVDGKREVLMSLFAKYPSEEASFEDHARLLAISPRYRLAMRQAGHPDAFAERLAHSGYSTNPAYAEMLTGAMREYDLYQYDVPTPPAAAKEVAA